jgi:hypothetical protein
MATTLQSRWVLEKTSKGRDEMGSRTHDLPLSIRRLLILADGRKTAGELMRASSDLTTSQAGLTVLLEDGYLQIADASPTSLSEAETGPAAEADQRHKPKLIALVREMFGPQAKLLQKFELAQNDPASLAVAIESCGKFIRLFINEPQADAFLRRAHAALNAPD